jgi:GxxExxY protein
MIYDEERVDELRGQILRCAIEVHRRLGPGLLESVYQSCLCIELGVAGLKVERNRMVPLVYRERPLQARLFIDLLVEDLVIVEVKAVAQLMGVHSAQVITYLKLADKPAGLLLNFNSVLMKDGTRRISHPDVLPRAGQRSRRPPGQPG